MAKVLIAGCGYLGTTLARRLHGKGHEVWGLRRDPSKLAFPIKAIEADLSIPNTLKAIPEVDQVVYAASPSGSDDAAYEQCYVKGIQYLIQALQAKNQKIERLILTSSTSVYAQQDGEWVDEDSPTEPTHHSGKRVLQGEELISKAPYPSVILRLGGIYGPERTRLIDAVKAGKASYPADRVHYANRLHIDDCAGALQHLLELENPDPIYIGADNEPIDRKSLLYWLADRLAAAAPAPATGSAGGRASNKRCSNKKLISSGYTLRYPSYREGYASVLASRKLL